MTGLTSRGIIMSLRFHFQSLNSAIFFFTVSEFWKQLNSLLICIGQL
jgi:hypothetical protein